MLFEEQPEGEYRIYAGAIEAPAQTGYLAAVVVSRPDGPDGKPRVAFKDHELAPGHRWESAEEALRFALRRGQEIIRNRPNLLGC